MRKQNPSLGAQFAERFKSAQRELGRAPRDGARELPRVKGLDHKCLASVPIENLYAAATQILVDSGNVYLYGNDVVVEAGVEGELSLQRLTTGSELLPGAPPILANHFTCESTGESFFAPPRCFVAPLLARTPTRDRLPKIITYAVRPVYDEGFVLRGPGYNAAQEILVHGIDVEPVAMGSIDASLPILDRLPPRLRALLGGFCFREPADVANALATLLTGVLGNHFVSRPKPTVNVDANQPGVGKTWLALATGGLLDGQLPDLIHFSDNDEELSKRMLANLRQRPTSALIFDNAKCRGGAEISSASVEANSMAPNITLRILGKSVNYTQPNHVLWFVTMNQTKLSPDLVSRGIAIRLFYEGDPAKRVFDGPSPLKYAIEYRAEILAELFGMIELWKSRGRPMGTRTHRCEYWAQIIGGILETCGFPEFLGNAAEAAAEFNTELSEIAAIAEWVVRGGNTAAFAARQPEERQDESNGRQNQASVGLVAADWINVFRGTKVELERLDAAKSARGRATIIGNFMARMIGRQVPIEVNGRTAWATLWSKPGRSRTTFYYFEVVFDGNEKEIEAPEGGPQTKATKAQTNGWTPSIGTRQSPIDRRPVPGMMPAGNDEGW